MMAIIDMIRKAGISGYEATNPVNIIYGTVSRTRPLEVSVDQRFTLTEDFLVITERVTRRTANIGQQELVIREGLQVGDYVVLLRVQGGQQYIVMDKVVNEDDSI